MANKDDLFENENIETESDSEIVESADENTLKSENIEKEIENENAISDGGSSGDNSGNDDDDDEELKDSVEINDKSRVINLDINKEVKKSFISYAMAVNVSRAIPDIRDGLKPVHRRIIYTFGSLGFYHDKPFKKSARIVGEVMGKYHPHGDTAIYDSLVRMAQDFTINAPLVDGQGNFGSVDGYGAAAMRYTEARLTRIAGELLKDIDKNTVDFVPNFDGSETQPVVLPARFPNLLINGSEGIAVGMATSIPPHNLAEVIDATVATIDNPEIDFDELLEILPAPDFPTRGLIMRRSGIKQAYKTGRGSFIIRARAEIEEYGKNNRTRIVITEIPYQVNKSKLIMQVVDLVKNKKIDGISDIRDESDRQGMRIVIEVKRDANAQVLLNALYKQTQLQISYGVIFLALVNGMPKLVNLKEYLFHYIEHQKEVITRRTNFLLDRAKAKAHILEGLVIAQENIDEVIKTIKQSDDKPQAQEELIRKFNLTEKQANAILEMRLQRLTGLEVEKLKNELIEVNELIKELLSILSDEQKLLNIIKEDLLEIKDRYGVPRKSEISLALADIDDEDLIEEEQVVISLSHEGYIKRISLDEYRSQHRGGRGAMTMKTKEEDFVANVFTTSTHDFLLCFSSLGKVYRIKGYEVPEAAKNSRGRAVVNLLELDQNERITAIIPIEKEEYESESQINLVMATKQGLIKKTNLQEFESIRRGGKIAITLVDDDELISVYTTNGNDEIIIASSNGKCIRFSEKGVRATGRSAQGVKSIALEGDEYVVDMSVIHPDKLMLTVSEHGFGKRSNPENYRLQGRAGKGIKAGVFNDETGNLVNLKQVDEQDDIMLIADDGNIIRIRAEDISIIGRSTKGVRLMRLQENSKIVGVAVVPNQEKEEQMAETAESKPKKEKADNVETSDNFANLESAETDVNENNENDEQNTENDLIDSNVANHSDDIEPEDENS